MIDNVRTIVFYLFSTSNHNRIKRFKKSILLSFISFLHQTTTVSRKAFIRLNCLLSLFYIKPQLKVVRAMLRSIVFYLFSTSNHNASHRYTFIDGIVFYLFSTSNHNLHVSWHQSQKIVFYLFSTSNHNPLAVMSAPTLLSFISFLHQTTTLPY